MPLIKTLVCGARKHYGDSAALEAENVPAVIVLVAVQRLTSFSLGGCPGGGQKARRRQPERSLRVTWAAWTSDPSDNVVTLLDRTDGRWIALENIVRCFGNREQRRRRRRRGESPTQFSSHVQSSSQPLAQGRFSTSVFPPHAMIRTSGAICQRSCSMYSLCFIVPGTSKTRIGSRILILKFPSGWFVSCHDPSEIMEYMRMPIVEVLSRATTAMLGSTL